MSARQTTLLTSHKGVDLHAASALLVMQDRLEGGGRLAALFRCELHTFWGEPAGWDAARLLDTGRYYNPNKHHFGIFEGSSDGPDWFGVTRPGQQLAPAWPGPVHHTDLASVRHDSAALYDALLGGAVAADCAPFDIVGFAHGQTGPVLSGVLWRLVIQGDRQDAAAVGETLAVARHRKQGLLVNPHMESWLTVAR
jgi:hypothetical protein